MSKRGHDVEAQLMFQIPPFVFSPGRFKVKTYPLQQRRGCGILLPKD